MRKTAGNIQLMSVNDPLQKLENNKHPSVSFDDYVDNYQQKIQESMDFIGVNADFFIQVKAEMVLELVKKYCGHLSSIRVLDIGSGIGLVDRSLAPAIKNLFGVDTEEGVVNRAKINNPGVHYQKYDGERLPFEDHSMDFVFAINVMHHVSPSLWQNFTNEMWRVLKSGGVAAIFEHNPMNPLTRRVVNRCEFDRDAVLLGHKKIQGLFLNSRLTPVEDAYILFFPFRGGIFRGIERVLKWIPLGAQQYVVGRKYIK